MALAISALAFVSISSSRVISHDRARLVRKPERRPTPRTSLQDVMANSDTWLAITTGSLLLIMLVAFLCCSIAITAYSQAGGWCGVAYTIVFMLVWTGLWIRQLLYEFLTPLVRIS
jgi:hypothetical protein